MATSWYKVTRTDWIIGEQFEALWLRNGGPANAALFAKRNLREKTTDFYFNPAAARLAADLLEEYGAVACPPLDLSQPHPFLGPFLYVGDQSIIEGNG